MNAKMTITYHYHSGFSAQVGSWLFVFDYWEGENRTLEPRARLTAETLAAYEQVVVFISHAHPDHMDPVVYSWMAGAPVTYVVSGDMRVGTRGKRMNPGDTLKLSQDVTVRAFDSTDLGVSFLVEAYGLRIFHAGDLNLWHWREESTLREIEAAQTAFEKALEPLKHERVDVAMFPVDPRQGEMYDAGANAFILAVKPRVFIPMHWQDRAEVATNFARRAKNAQTETLALTRPGTVARFTWTDDALSIRVREPVAAADGKSGEEGGDPFIDTDLPVDLQ